MLAGKRPGGWLVAATAWLAVASLAMADDRAEAVARESAFRERVATLLDKYCVGCHGGEKPKADLDLAALSDLTTFAKERKRWETILAMVDDGSMPPEGEPAPIDDERAALVGWIEAALTTADCDLREPGRVTLRRLNRAEYDNTVRDLIGLDLRPADDFPSDDVGYGFDNIGDVLTLPPLLLERYLDAAEKIATEAIVAPEEAIEPREHREAEALDQRAGGGDYQGVGRILASSGEVGARFEFPEAGRYRLRIRAFGDQAGDQPVRMAIRLDDRTLAEVDVPGAEAADAVDYDVEADVPAGRHRLVASFLNDYYDPDHADPKLRGDRNLIVDSFSLFGPIRAAGEGELPDSHRRIITRRPDGDDWGPAAREVIGAFASRAFRRPATAEEVDRLARLVDLVKADGGSFERGVQLGVQAALASPHFLFRAEPEGPAAEGPDANLLGDYELASRLSYFLWSSMPDAALFGLAAEGKLSDPEVLEAQARRMLADPRASAMVENFCGQWLQLRNLKQFQPDPEQFPGFDDAMRSSMAREAELFFGAITAEDRSILELLDTDFTFVDERLAKHYGIDGVQGDEFRRVAVDRSRRGGVLTMGGVLAVTSNPTRTSPVKRGKWILEQLLGAPPPPPPPDVPELKEDKEARLSGSLRQRMEQHRANPSCASCHARMDPLGFGLENYDATGAWRDRDGEFPVDASGVLPSGESFRGPGELKAILMAGRADAFERCLAEKMLTYALGRGLEHYDACAIDEITGSLRADGHRFTRLVAAIVRSDPFRKRSPAARAEGGD